MNKSFNPVNYSIPENQFLLAHIGLPPSVAFQDPVPQGVSVKAINDALSEVYDLCELEKHRGNKWCGLPAVKSAIEVYLREAEKWATQKRNHRGAVRFPSMHTFDSRGRAHRGGPGSDSGIVKTYFDAQGNRHNFEVEYQGETPEWVPEWLANGQAPPQEGSIIDTPAKSRLECPVCGHTESYNTDSNSSRNAAKARMSKHFKKATKDVDAHREASVQEFGGTAAVIE